MVDNDLQVVNARR